jgi:YHS domain-containing protein
MKQENYYCTQCKIEIEGNPKHALIRNDFPVFCTKECLEQFVKTEREQKQ